MSDITEIKTIFETALRLGVVSSIEANCVRVNLHNAGAMTGSLYQGARYGLGEVGEFVLVEGELNALLGRIVEVRLPERERLAVDIETGDGVSVDAVASVQLLGTVALDTLKVKTGVANYPRLGDRVYSAPDSFLSSIPLRMENNGEKTKVLLHIGKVSSATSAEVLITPEKLFGRHCAILGATGGGKSWTTARVIQECLKHNAKIILLDATGEYRDFKGNEIIHCHLEEHVEKAVGSKEVSLPPTCFLESDFIALFEPAGKVQGPKLRAAIRSLRLAKLKPTVFTEGYVKKIDQSKAAVETAEREQAISSKLDDPRQEFDVKFLIKQIEQECVYPDGFGAQRGQKDITKWGGEDGNFSHCLSLISRINGILTSPAFKCVFNSSASTLVSEIETFVRDDSKKLLRICLSGVAHEFNAREIIANVIGRYLLTKARGRQFLKRPIVVIVDEAHNFLGRHIGTEDYASRLDSFEIIAKEGRKHSLNICLATQRPRDITEGVLSQMGTLIVHRLTNDKDREVVERACGELDRSASAFLPNLEPGEATIVGVDFPIPLTILINEPTITPYSQGANYQEHWNSKKGTV